MTPAQWFWLFQQMGMPTGAATDATTQPPGVGGPGMMTAGQDTGEGGVDLPPISPQEPTTAPFGPPGQGGPGSYPDIQPLSTIATGAGDDFGGDGFGGIPTTGLEPGLGFPSTPPGTPEFPGADLPEPPGAAQPDVAAAIPLSSDEETLLRGGVSGPLYPTSQDVFPQPSMFDELGRPTNWAGAGQFFRDAAGNIVDAAGNIIQGARGLIGDIASNIMNDPGYSSPQYLSSIGYRQDFPGGAYWPTAGGRVQVPGTTQIGNLGGDAVTGADVLGGGAYDRQLMQQAYKGIFMSPGDYGQYLAQSPNAFGRAQPGYQQYLSNMRALQAALRANPQLMAGGPTASTSQERTTRGSPPPSSR